MAAFTTLALVGLGVAAGVGTTKAIQASRRGEKLEPLAPAPSVTDPSLAPPPLPSPTADQAIVTQQLKGLNRKRTIGALDTGRGIKGPVPRRPRTVAAVTAPRVATSGSVRVTRALPNVRY